MREHPASPVRLWPHIFEVSKRERRERTEEGRRGEGVTREMKWRGGEGERRKGEREKVDGE